MSTETTVAKPQIKISEVQAMLAEGKDREAIRIHYNLKKSELKALFMHPKLKGKKVKKTLDRQKFTIVDDTEGTAATSESASAVAEVAPEAEEEKVY